MDVFHRARHRVKAQGEHDELKVRTPSRKHEDPVKGSTFIQPGQRSFPKLAHWRYGVSPLQKEVISVSSSCAHPQSHGISRATSGVICVISHRWGSFLIFQRSVRSCQRLSKVMQLNVDKIEVSNGVPLLLIQGGFHGGPSCMLTKASLLSSAKGTLPRSKHHNLTPSCFPPSRLLSSLLSCTVSTVSFLRRAEKTYNWLMYRTFLRVHLLSAALRGITFKSLWGFSHASTQPTAMRVTSLLWGVCVGGSVQAGIRVCLYVCGVYIGACRWQGGTTEILKLLSVPPLLVIILQLCFLSGCINIHETDKQNPWTFILKS